MAKQAILTESAPKPLPGIYSQAIVANGTVYCSGQVGLDPNTNKLVEGDIGARTHQCLKNLYAVLEAAGTTPENAVKVNVFIADMKDFAAMNEVYVKYWGETMPCRTCVAVKQLPLGTDVEIECIAVLPGVSAGQLVSAETRTSNELSRSTEDRAPVGSRARELRSKY